jgi:hypothetical protein
VGDNIHIVPTDTLSMKSVFDNYTNGKYAESYEKANADFYTDMALQLMKHVPPGGRVLDIGTGPASLEKALVPFNPEFSVIAVEPSDTVEDAKKVELNFPYDPVRGTMMDAPDLFDLNDIDAMVFPRSPHEIAKSMGGKPEFWSGFYHIDQYVKVGGIVMFADPMYNPSVVSNPELLAAAAEWNKKHIGHNDSIEQMFTPAQVSFELQLLGFDPVYLNVHDHQQHVDEFGVSVNQFFVLTSKKGKKNENWTNYIPTE